MIWLASLLAGLSVGQTQPSCLRDGDRISGEFRYVESRHPNGTSLRYGFVVVPEPVCVVAESPETGELYVVRGRWIQISYADEQVGGHPHAGDIVTITGNYSEPHTAWHLGDIVGSAVRVIAAERM
jgi:hypothetical protein